MRETVGYTVKSVSDHSHKELSPAEVLDVFTNEYVNINSPLNLLDYHFVRSADSMKAFVTVEFNGVKKDISANGNGRLDAISNAFKENLGFEYSNLTYTEHALTSDSDSKAVTYVSVMAPTGKVYWGVGVHNDIIASSVYALVSAINRSIKA